MMLQFITETFHRHQKMPARRTCGERVYVEIIKSPKNIAKPLDDDRE